MTGLVEHLDARVPAVDHEYLAAGDVDRIRGVELAVAALAALARRKPVAPGGEARSADGLVALHRGIVGFAVGAVDASVRADRDRLRNLEVGPEHVQRLARGRDPPNLPALREHEQVHVAARIDRQAPFDVGEPRPGVHRAAARVELEQVQVRDEQVDEAIAVDGDAPDLGGGAPASDRRAGGIEFRHLGPGGDVDVARGIDRDATVSHDRPGRGEPVGLGLCRGCSAYD